MQINGRNIFLNGVNWVPYSLPYYGATRREGYVANYLSRFRDMNCNILAGLGGRDTGKRGFL